jgi:hypothetical protein
MLRVIHLRQVRRKKFRRLGANSHLILRSRSMDDDFLQKDGEWPVQGRAFGDARPKAAIHCVKLHARKRPFVGRGKIEWVSMYHRQICKIA